MPIMNLPPLGDNETIGPMAVGTTPSQTPSGGIEYAFAYDRLNRGKLAPSQLYRLEELPRSPVFVNTRQSQTATRRFRCNWSMAQEIAIALQGFSQWRSGKLLRWLPDYVPTSQTFETSLDSYRVNQSKPFLYCTQATIEPEVMTGYESPPRNIPSGGSLSTPSELEQGTALNAIITAVYQGVRYNVDYGYNLPTPWVEGFRFVQRDESGQIETITGPPGIFKWLEGPGNGHEVTSTPPLRFPQTKLRLTWFGVPSWVWYRYFVGADHGKDIFVNYVGTINVSEFFNCDADSLLMEAPEVEPYVGPDGIENVNITYVFCRNFQGWNRAPYSDGNFYHYGRKSDGSPFFQESDFTQLFVPTA